MRKFKFTFFPTVVIEAADLESAKQKLTQGVVHHSIVMHWPSELVGVPGDKKGLIIEPVYARDITDGEDDEQIAGELPEASPEETA
jgi:hypothetical protein